MIFDFDGTIVDSFETLLGVFDEIIGRKKPLSSREVELLRGMSMREIVKYLGLNKWQLPGMVFKAKKSIALKLPDIKTFPEIPEVIARLHKDGCKLYILSTNSTSNIDNYLVRNRLGHYFIQIYGDIGLRGKSPALKKLMKKENLNHSDCVYVGDEVRDVESAKKAGVTSVGVTWGFNNKNAITAAEPKYICNSPKELLKLLS